MTITALPTPPSRTDAPATFITKADAFIAALPQFVTETNAQAAAFLDSGIRDTSASSNSIGTGAKTFTVSSAKGYQPGMYLIIADAVAPSTNSMYGQVTSYSGTTLMVNILSVTGSGTKTAWAISQSTVGGATSSSNTFTGLQTFAVGANIASAATVDLTAATGNTLTITGTTTVTAFTMTAGQQMELIAAGALPLTYHATTMNINGGVSYTCAAGDRLFVNKAADNVVRVNVVKQDGTAVSGTGGIKPIAASVAANALTLTINPTTLDFRSTTLTDGTPTTIILASAVSVVVPSTATLGTVDTISARLAVLAINNAGTIEAAVVNLAGGNQLDETNLISTTAISATADSDNVIYSTTARTSVAYRVVGFIDITEATAGTWATAPTLVQGVGGNLDKVIPIVSTVQLNTANGYGSANTRIRRFTNVVKNVGSDITYSDSATLGASFTIDTPGVYSIAYTETMTSANGIGVSLNTTQAATNITSINAQDILTLSATPAASIQGFCSVTVPLTTGDVVRPHTNAGVSSGTLQFFTITRVS